ncbi:RNA polymerase sigma factor [Prevotella brunnea]|uniref:RNA polymerase sigma factor n=1 Tax=Prevotella brunnea TaxID=2508867 RepID=A0A5C8GJV5_9BACT|nr:RNA polymerase sigma factor [Prevotella brunnea]TXJ62120.1 RNA polymerase sigma factor [Prevotella brunnea]
MNASQFKSLFLPCHRKLYAVAWRLTGNGKWAEDLVQDTYLRLWTKRDTLHGIDNAEAYSVTVLRRAFYDVQRAKHIETVGKDIAEMQIKEHVDMARQLETIDECERIKQMITRLPDPQGKIMLMRDVEEMPYNEISQATGLSETNVRTILSRARKQIREQIKEMKR